MITRSTDSGSSGTPPATLLVAEDVRKSYGPRLALRGLSFSLGAGRILGFLGPNGAGKTTAIRVLTTMLEPSAGRFVVDGIGSDRPEEIRRRIGVLPEGLGFPRHMTGLEYLVFFGQLYRRTAADARTNALGLLDDVGLAQRGSTRIGTYSHGMRQRLGIARALVNDPVVVFLDEPTLGLDPRGQQDLLGLVQRIARERSASIVLCSHLLSEIEGVCDDVVILNLGLVQRIARERSASIVLCSHLLSEIEGVCDDVVILNLGQVVASGAVADVLGDAERNVIQVRVAAESTARAREILASLPSVRQVTVTDELTGRLAVELAEADDGRALEDRLARNTLLDALVRADVPIVAFGSGGNRLQELFLQVTDEAIS